MKGSAKPVCYGVSWLLWLRCEACVQVRLLDAAAEVIVDDEVRLVACVQDRLVTSVDTGAAPMGMRCLSDRCSRH